MHGVLETVALILSSLNTLCLKFGLGLTKGYSITHDTAYKYARGKLIRFNIPFKNRMVKL